MSLSAQGGPDESGLGDAVEATLIQWARQCREQNGLVVLPHLPNPRAEGAAALVLNEIDAVEICSFENTGISPYSLSDWYRYLNCGYLIPAVGGTDKMSQITAVGTIRTYALIKNNAFTYTNWMDAVCSGHTFVSYGPLLDFHINEHEMGSEFNLPASGGTLDIVWQASSVTVPISRIELIVNGELSEEKTVNPSEAHIVGVGLLPLNKAVGSPFAFVGPIPIRAR